MEVTARLSLCLMRLAARSTQPLFKAHLISYVLANWWSYDDFAVIELAQASGLALVGNELDAINAHTVGTGQLILTAFAHRFKKVIICLGGSASTEGGAGVLAALHTLLLNAQGRQIRRGASELYQIVRCYRKPMIELLADKDLLLAVDVVNPLLGANGAAAAFAPQKGASFKEVAFLEQGLSHFADVLEAASGNKVRDLPGCGAAGGTAFGIACAAGGKIISGFDLLASLIGLETKIKEAHLIITAEGNLDNQSLSGKAVGRLALLCKENGRPLYALPARYDQTLNWQEAGIEKIVPTQKSSLDATLQDVEESTISLFS